MIWCTICWSSVAARHKSEPVKASALRGYIPSLPRGELKTLAGFFVFKVRARVDTANGPQGAAPIYLPLRHDQSQRKSVGKATLAAIAGM